MNQLHKYKSNILLIDDLSDNLQLLSELLLLGYNVSSVTCETILEKTFKVKSVDVILVNINTPKINCYQICEIIQSYNLNIPIILLVSLDDVFDKIKAFQCGVVDYITRPFPIDEVVIKLETQLTIKKQTHFLEQEIKKRKNIEEILHNSRALILSVLNSSKNAIAAFQSVRQQKTKEIKDFRCIVVNPIFVKLFNCNPNDIIGKLGFKNLIAQINKDLFDDIVKVVETGQSLEKDLYHPSGESCWYQFVIVKLEDGFAITVRDITVSKKFEIQLQAMANLDGLTQIANRRCFDEYLNKEWLKHLEQQKPLTLIMIDIDYFKLYNDYYGHQEGDECIYRVAQGIAMIKRPTDLVARYGGEEFAVILPSTKIEDGLMIADLIQSTISSFEIPHEKSKISSYVTLSIGISSLIPNLDTISKDLIAKADKALYEAKNQGRDRIVSD
ncbi:diguanylate cyclase domain-containing protein [Geminocystis sp. NIES-3709]|uniref:GGDEF domain-containing response regulator n=1 Tax=Geminocystis sp. NIES-3709 TaxID=1617448 RepID=UPI0005FCB63C|nr:diguanylate cyclase [Geminocystis sp. NIES-3709]BAQ66844.1 two-component response regulator [Geminocystis sp. NIES-3709]